MVYKFSFLAIIQHPHFHLRKTGGLPDKEEVVEFMGMGGVYRTIQRFNGLNLFRKNSDDEVGLLPGFTLLDLLSWYLSFAQQRN